MAAASKMRRLMYDCKLPLLLVGFDFDWAVDFGCVVFATFGRDFMAVTPREVVMKLAFDDSLIPPLLPTINDTPLPLEG